MDKELEKRHQKARKYAIVAIELVREGLFLDEFMTDKRASVRAAVVEYHPHLRKIMLTDKITAAVWRKYYNLLYTDTHPDKELITRSGQLGLRENRLGHSSAGMCCRTHAYMGAWIEVCKNVIKRTITNHMVAPTEVRGLKFCGTVDRSVHIYDLLKRFHFEAFFVF